MTDVIDETGVNRDIRARSAKTQRRAYPEGVPAGLSPMHLLVIMVVALVVLGPDKLPDAVRTAARFLGEARQWSASMSEELHSAASMEMRETSPPMVESAPTSSGAGSGAATAPAPSAVEGSPAGGRPSVVDANPVSPVSRSRETDHTSLFAKEQP